MREYPENPRVGVCAIVTRGDEILLVQRGIAPSKGLWTMPGGSVKLGETLADVAGRETEEETGVAVCAGDHGCVLDFIERDDAGSIRFHFVIVYVRCAYVSGAAAGASDAVEARWFTRSELGAAAITPHTMMALKTIGFLS